MQLDEGPDQEVEAHAQQGEDGDEPEDFHGPDGTAPAAELPGTVPGVEPLRRPPITFAHRGGRGHGPDNTIETFQRGLELGATGLETDAWLTADGVVVLDHDGSLRRRLRRRRMATLRRDELPASIPSLAELYAACGTGFELSVDVRDPRTGPAVIEVAREADPGAPKHLWLCHHDWKRLAQWRGERAPSDGPQSWPGPASTPSTSTTRTGAEV
ncbi:MAG: glycerophosphodiester phosphodiesterase [Actinobacteria bacterium]|nr:glycerophosphodiester phosphodiesterase [Actinomycetota bacterium]